MYRNGIIFLYKEAKQKVVKADRERSAYYNQTSDFRWGDPANYDVCYNTDRIELKTAAKWIADMAIVEKKT